jgi:8-oxo-dGTP pyrophosphatase MutT (NUDIX family)
MTELSLTPWQVLRTRLHLLFVALRKRQTVGARAVLIDRDKVLLVRHTYTPGWQFPGGGVEPFETAQAAAARESLEETGYRVSGPAVLHGVFLNRIAGGGRDHVALYVWRSCEQVRAFRTNVEIAECGWFPLAALPQETESGTRRRLHEVAAGNPPAAEW